MTPPGQIAETQRRVNAKVESIRTKNGQSDHDKRVEQDTHLDRGRNCCDELSQWHAEKFHKNDDHQLQPGSAQPSWALAEPLREDLQFWIDKGKVKVFEPITMIIQ